MESFFSQICQLIVPDIRRLPQHEQDAGLKLVRETLATKPKSVRFQFGFFLVLIRTWLLLRSVLGRPQASDALDFFYRSPIGLFRKGFWGVCTLAKMSYYSQPSAVQKTGYRQKEMSHESK